MITFLWMLYLAFTLFMSIMYLLFIVSMFRHTEEPLRYWNIIAKYTLFLAVLLSILWSIWFHYYLY